jgi:hypothetical protein
MMSSTQFTISSIVVLFSSINCISSEPAQYAEGPPRTHTKVLERRPCRSDRCLSGWYDYERLLGYSKSRLERAHHSLSMIAPPRSCFVDLDGVRRRAWLRLMTSVRTFGLSCAVGVVFWDMGIVKATGVAPCDSD